MKDWTESVWVGLSLIMGCAILTVIVTCMGLGKQVLRSVYEDRRVTEMMVEYRKSYQYDNKEVYPSDATSLIIELKGSTPITVINKDGTEVTWDNKVSMPIPATGLGASSVLNQDSMYLSSIEMDANGVVAKYTFTEQ